MEQKVQFAGGLWLWLYYKQWESITSDLEVLQTISCLHIPIQQLPKQRKEVNYPINERMDIFILEEIERLIKKKVIERCQHERDEYISPSTFVTERADGGYRFILNLKKLNEEIDKKKFKMQTLKSILCLVRPNTFMAKLDIKDAYYSIPIHQESRKMLKFIHKGKLYQFRALPNRYTEGPRKFTKIMKPPLSCLRKRGIVLADYIIDDLITMNKSQSRYSRDIESIIELLDSLAFVIFDP